MLKLKEQIARETRYSRKNPGRSPIVVGGE
jgi:hypothetical protein